VPPPAPPPQRAGRRTPPAAGRPRPAAGSHTRRRLSPRPRLAATPSARTTHHPHHPHHPPPAGPALAAGVTLSGVADGATVASPLHLEMGVAGMAVKPAADGLAPGTGHFHLMVDAPALAAGEAIPFDAAHLHYGKGQTSADVELAAGTHTLTLQFADAAHRALAAPYVASVTVNVK